MNTEICCGNMLSPCIQRWVTRLVQGLEAVSCEEQPRVLDLSGLKKRRLNMTSLLSTALWGSEVGREVLSFSPCNLEMGCVGMAQSCSSAGSDWTLGNISSNSGTGALGRWSMPQACQCFRGVWTLPLTALTWLAWNWSGSWTRWLL